MCKNNAKNEAIMLKIEARMHKLASTWSYLASILVLALHFAYLIT